MTFRGVLAGLTVRTVRFEEGATMHVHVGLLHAFIFALYLLVVGAGIRILSAQYPDSAIGKALAFIY